jgi:hypothetical protein
MDELVNFEGLCNRFVFAQFIWLGFMPGDSGFESRQGQGDFIFSKMQRAVIFTHLNPGRFPMELRGPSLRFTTYCYVVAELALSNPIFLSPAYSPALIYFGRERGWWVTCNYPAVLKEKNRNRKSTTCAICWLKSVLHEEKNKVRH